MCNFKTRKRGVGTIPRLRVGLVLKPLVQLLAAILSGQPRGRLTRYAKARLCSAIWLGSSQVVRKGLGKAEAFAVHPNDEVVMEWNTQHFASVRKRPSYSPVLTTWQDVPRWMVVTDYAIGRLKSTDGWD